MKKIKCEIIDGEYVCDIDITVAEWRSLLRNPAVFDEKSKEALKKWYIEPNHSATCFDIGVKYNLHSMSANGVINGLGGRVQKELGRFEVEGVGNIAVGTRFITVMQSKETESKPKRFLWTIREELVQAIKDLDYFGANKPSPKVVYSDEVYSDDELVNGVGEDDIPPDTTVFGYVGKPRPKKAAVEVGSTLTYSRSKSVSKNALAKAGYKCEINGDHPTFKRRNSHLNYTEPHHIIPMSRQDDFDVSLDVEENIISLCCNCHKQIHLGQGFDSMLKTIHGARNDFLKNVGIDVPLENLVLLYKNGSS